MFSIDIHMYTHATNAALSLSLSLNCLEKPWPANPVQGTNVEVSHIFSVEIDEFKRSIIAASHSPKHMFSDVSCFHTLKGFCHQCQADHDLREIDLGIDILAAGPSCKDLSHLNNQRSAKHGCYERDEDGIHSGTSGPTYIYGFKKVAWQVRGWREHSAKWARSSRLQRPCYITTYINIWVSSTKDV